MKKLVCTIFFLFLFTINGDAQSTIGGIINIYTPVVSLGCNSATVISTSGFAVGDRALIIQMKGAVIDSSNSPTFGTVTNYSTCGNYELTTISSITGSTVFFQYQLLNNYTPTGLVQLIRVPQYTNTTVTSALTCMPWNGSTGGVLVMEVSGTLTLNANIDVSGKGFRGGIACTNPDGSCGSGYTDYFYPVSSGFGAEKGEGITVMSALKDGGRGALANGGGGGNKHNSGGGGGGNYSYGGVGGNQANFCPPDPVGGRGGLGLDYSLNKIFLGGGGGCSDNNNGVGTPGSEGGGIVIIRANTIIGNSNSIVSNGVDVSYIFNNIGDGAGGGGAGGTILLEVPAYTSILNIMANGGKGGDQFTNYGSCFGPGGGGGTGLIYTSVSSLPANVIPTTQPGVAGIDLYSGSPCYLTSYGAAAGQTATAIKYNLLVPEDDSIASISLFVNLGNDTINCTGDSITLNAYNASATYLWSTGDTTSSILAATGGIYSVSVFAPGCPIPYNDTINISSPGALILDLGNDTLICNNDSLILNAYNLGATYLWSTGATSSTIVADTDGTYWVNVMLNTCSFSIYDTISISTASPPLVSLGNDTTLCSGSVNMNVTNPGASYIWSTGDSSSAITISSTNPGMYWVSVTTSGCAAVNDTVIVYGPTAISLDLGNDTSFCGNFIVLNASNPGTTYLWSTSDTAAAILTNVSGTYWVSVSTITCPVTVNDTIVINISIPPFVNLGIDTVLCSDSLLLDAMNPGASYLWSTGETTQTIIVTNPGTYWVNVVSENCNLFSADTISITGSGVTAPIEIPNVMTPNADSQNDFVSIGSNDGPELHWTIYNRWGEKIYSENGNKLTWNAYYNNALLVAGTYFWILDYLPNCSVEKIIKKGYITVIR